MATTVPTSCDTDEDDLAGMPGYGRNRETGETERVHNGDGSRNAEVMRANVIDGRARFGGPENDDRSGFRREHRRRRAEVAKVRGMAPKGLLVLLTSWCDDDGRVIKTFTQEELAERLGASESSVKTIRTARDALVRDGWITFAEEKRRHLGGNRWAGGQQQFRVNLDQLYAENAPPEVAGQEPSTPQEVQGQEPSTPGGVQGQEPGRLQGLGLDQGSDQNRGQNRGAASRPGEPDDDDAGKVEGQTYVEDTHVVMLMAAVGSDVERAGVKARTDDTEAQGVEAEDWDGDPWGEAQGQSHPLWSLDEVPPASEPPAEHEEVAA